MNPKRLELLCDCRFKGLGRKARCIASAVFWQKSVALKFKNALGHGLGL
jgi:hypothetical protein